MMICNTSKISIFDTLNFQLSQGFFISQTSLILMPVFLNGKLSLISKNETSLSSLYIEYLVLDAF